MELHPTNRDLLPAVRQSNSSNLVVDGDREDVPTVGEKTTGSHAMQHPRSRLRGSQTRTCPRRRLHKRQVPLSFSLLATENEAELAQALRAKPIPTHRRCRTMLARLSRRSRYGLPSKSRPTCIELQLLRATPDVHCTSCRKRRPNIAHHV